MEKSNNDEDLKLNKIFAKELKRCRMLLEICFADDIEDKIIINKTELDEMKNKSKESKETNQSSKNNSQNNNH